MSTHSSVLAWRIPWTEEPGGLQSMGPQSQTLLKQLSIETCKLTYKGKISRVYALIKVILQYTSLCFSHKIINFLRAKLLSYCYQWLESNRSRIKVVLRHFEFFCSEYGHKQNPEVTKTCTSDQINPDSRNRLSQFDLRSQSRQPFAI